MAKTLPVRGTRWLDEQLHACRTHALQADDPGPFDDRQELAFDLSFKTDRLLSTDRPLLGRALKVDSIMRCAALEYAAGAPPDQVRTIYRQAAEAWLPVVEEMDFIPRAYEDSGWTTPTMAMKRIELFGGEIIERKGQYVRCRWTAMPQPFEGHIYKAFQCAAISGDFRLARHLARSYPIRPVHQYTERFARRRAIIRHLLAGDDHDARLLAARLEHGYTADFPPERIEFPLGVVKSEPAILAKGLKATNTRFNSMWSETKYRRRHAKWIETERPAASPWKQHATWEEFSDWVRQQLTPWLISTWAVAFLNIAAWRGMSSPFDQPSLFSQWTPLELVQKEGS